MSFELSKKVDFPQTIFQFLPGDIDEEEFQGLPLLGGILSDSAHLWHARGPCIEVRHISNGKKVGCWVFGGFIRDLHTKVICLDEIKAENGRLPLLVVALETVSGGQICVLDVCRSRVLRAINIGEQISSIHVVDPGNDISIIAEPSPFRYFDGIVAVGTRGGNVFLVDICRQICEDATKNPEVSIFRDELDPCDMVVLPCEKLENIKRYIERSMEKGQHIGVHINAVPKPKTNHFTLRGEGGEDRVYVNKSEAEVSCLYFSTQLASLIVGYNFGAFQLWDLRNVSLVYTSPICEDHIPVTHFAVQEPADDPKAYCYIWVSYSQNLLFSSGVPYAVMYSFYYDNKTFLGGYGNLYENFQHCSIRFQIELGTANIAVGFSSRVKGGRCLAIQSLHKSLLGSSLALCLVSWLVWDANKELQTCFLLFDLNQWYKEQMPSAPDWSNCSNYIIKNGINTQLLDVKLDQKSITQFLGVQKLEEHFCPTSLSFDVLSMTDCNILKIHNKSLQRAVINKLEEDGHLALCRPSDYYERIVSLGLIPIFCDIPANLSSDTGFQRELLLNMILEQKLVHWLCKCASKLANDAFNVQGLPLNNLLDWAFQRAINLKTSCDHFCTCLFDFSGIRLDSNTIALVNNSISQLKNICSFYHYVSSKLLDFICDIETVIEEEKCLRNVTVYYEVLLWMVNIGLLPEGKTVQQIGDLSVAPYEVEMLTKYYIGKRTRLQEVSHQTFVEKDCLLFIDNLINNQPAGSLIRQHWQEDGGSGLYPPPSLQSALRVYLLDGTDIIFKHDLMTYTLLDMAMTLDENEKINVIKMLLKFPQIFDMNQSRIKIIQAFWHLDHDDYQTALDYILDPSVLSEDLHQWHHSVMMKSLLLQDQFTLALLYFQIRKPSLCDEKDLLTVLSLLISKNMLDEAFKFQQNFQGRNGESLLMHIFNECNKNRQLYSLLFRCLNTDEERAFFRYLKTTKSPRCEDLKVFYYLLRSRFFEAFDTYSSSKVRNPETQGLLGQNNATTADNVVKMFKVLMPDVNKTLVDILRKEKTNIWKEVNRPTPLSVFAHNPKERVCYKSDIIFATLSKAKRTFSDSFYDNMVKDVDMEKMPFLRAPLGVQSKVKSATPVLNCTIIEQNDEYAPSTPKKLKLSPRKSTASSTKNVNNLSMNKTLSKLTTPIVKRKSSMNTSGLVGSIRLPHGILKGSRTLSEISITERSDNLPMDDELSVEKSKLTLRARKSMTPSKVKFTDLRYSTSSNEQNSSRVSDNSAKESESASNEDAFYSPITSPTEAKQSAEDTHKERCKTPETLEVVEENKESALNEMEKIITDYSKHRMVYQSPQSRRSYKRSLGESPLPVRSSPRRKSASEASPNVVAEPVAVQTLRGRRSLTRTVLEHNTFSKVLVTSYSEKSILEDSVDSNFTDSSVDSEGLFLTHGQAPILESSLVELMKKYKNYDSNDTSFDESINSDQEDAGLDGSETNLTKSDAVGNSSPQPLNESKPVKSIEQTDLNVDESKMSISESQVVAESGLQSLNESKHEKDDTVVTPTDIMKEEESTSVEENLIHMDAHPDEESVDIQAADYNSYVQKPSNFDEIKEQSKSSRQAVNESDADNDQMDENRLMSVVYEDLSSGSEDLRDILQKSYENNGVFNAPNPKQLAEQKQSSAASEKDDSSRSPQEHYGKPSILDQGFTADVIQIDSSDDEINQRDRIHSSSSSSESSRSLNFARVLNDSENSISGEGDHISTNRSEVSDESNGTSSSGNTINVEKHKDHEDNSFDSQKTEKALTLRTEGSVELHEQSSRDSEKTEKFSDHETKEMNKESGSDSTEDNECEEAPSLPHPAYLDEEPSGEDTEVTNDDAKTNAEYYEEIIEANKGIKVGTDAIEAEKIDNDEGNTKSLRCTLIYNEQVASSSITDKSRQEPTREEENSSSDHNSANEENTSPPLLIRTIRKTYSKVEKEEQELNKTPVLKPVEKTYLRRKNLTSSLLLSGRDSELTETTTREHEDIIKSRKNIDGQLDGSKKVEDIADQSSKSNTDETERPKRITRRMSTHLETDQTSNSPTPAKLAQKVLKVNIDTEQCSTPGTPKSRRRPPKSKNSSQVSSGEDSTEGKLKIVGEMAGTSSETTKNRQNRSEVVKPQKRLRSASVDQQIDPPPAIRTYSRKTRSKSVDESVKETRSDIGKVKEKTSQVMLESISETPGSKVNKGKATSELATYTTARRLTRTQVRMLKAINEGQTENTKLPSVDEMDPINLLDKQPFKGDPDPEESKVYEPSSQSSSPSISASQRSRRRSTSVVSDVHSIKPPSVSSKASKTTGIKSRLRSALTEGDSDVSDSPSPSKKTKKNVDMFPVEETTPPKRTSGKSKTARSDVSSASNRSNISTRSTRSRKTATKAKELSKINEEK